MSFTQQDAIASRTDKNSFALWQPLPERPKSLQQPTTLSTHSLHDKCFQFSIELRLWNDGENCAGASTVTKNGASMVLAPRLF